MVSVEKELEIIKEMESITGTKLSEEQLVILKHRGGMCILACAGSGKALKNGTGVMTPDGYVNIEELKVGDVCYDNNGEKQTVIGVYPQGKKEVYRVEFSDGNNIDCSDDHLWTYQTYNMRRTTGKWKTESLRSIINNVPVSIYPHTNKKGETQLRANIYIPMSKPVKFDKKDLPMKPYALGALLGDGCLKNHSQGCSYLFSNMDRDVVDKVDGEIRELGAFLADRGDGINFRITVGNGYGRVKSKGYFTTVLDDLGLQGKGSYDKFIPDIYKYSSVDDRLELLRGLIDTDGHCMGTAYEYASMSEKLIDDVKFIAESLGMTAVKAKKEASCMYKGVRSEIKEGYRLYIKASGEINKIHWSARKDTMWKNGQTDARRTIINIVKTSEEAEMTCIKVSGENELFLTENFIVTHNTTSLINLIAKRIKTGEIKNPKSLMCTTYSKGGADELSERLNKLLPKLGIREKVTVKTLHALYLQVLKAFSYTSNIISNSDRVRFIRESIKEAGLNLDQEEIQTVDSLLSYQVNNLLSDENLISTYVYTLDSVSLNKYTEIRNGYNRRKLEKGVMDFDDLQLLMYVRLVKQNDKDMLNYCLNKWTDFYVDEAQDISKIQFEILKKMVSKPDNLVFIGDDDQCIYQWRGADPSILLNINGTYDIAKFVLSTNYRCKGNIVRPAATGIVNNARRSEKTMTPYEEGGEINIVDTGGGDLYNQSKYAFAYIKDLIENKGVQANDIAVLSRNNVHLSILNNMLFREGIFSDISPEMRFTGSYMYTDIKNVISLMEDSSDSFMVRQILWKMCRFLGLRGAGYISDFQKNTGMDLRDTLGYILWSNGKLKEDNPRYQRIPGALRMRIQGMYSQLKNDTTSDLELVYRFLDDKNKTTSVMGLIGMYLEGTSFMYSTTDKKQAVEGVVEYVMDLIRQIGIDKIHSFFRASEQVEKGSMDTGGDKVTMSTMHGAKGKEWKYVVMFADDNVAFPSFEGIEAMIKKGVSASDISNSIDENRRLHYVAMTRAKDNLTIFTDKNNPSIFMLEAFGLYKPDNKSSNGLIIRMAQTGSLVPELIERAHKYLFNKEYAYFKEVDISNVMSTKVPEPEGVEFTLDMEDEDMGAYL